MAVKQKELQNINAIGTADNPVTTIHAKYIAGVEAIYYTPPVYTTSPDAQTLTGVKFNTGTGNLEFSAPIVSDFTMTGKLTVTGNIACSGYYNQAGVASKGLSVNAAGDVTFYQKIVATGNIEANGNIDLSTNYINGTGENAKGISFQTDGQADFEQDVTIAGGLQVTDYIKLDSGSYINGDGGATKGLRFDNTGNAWFEQDIDAAGDINVSGVGSVFRAGGTGGITQVINLGTASTITVTRGIITGVT